LQIFKSGKNFTIGLDYDIYLNDDLPDNFFIGIVNPDNTP